MNKKKKAVKKMIFEPKAPTQVLEEVKEEDIPVIQDTQIFKGKFSPLQLQYKKHIYKYNPTDNLILNIPFNSESMSFIVFEDDTCGLKINNQIIALDAVHVDNDTVMEHLDEQCVNICNVNYILVPRGTINI
ncbi:hypothetical protein AAJ76_4000013328 [Vairimorpha ceranae]|uniref:Uncharacterized protein n=1 Tax=Vairimorpha ceranae TaxID=40302 RepID=A0A0F9WDL8_9MICR|nr:hypothetical protein AAJ76_4000013328 [Vairimorpha ceranae]KAF5141805.1 hypothetical protein G9O61_00g000880 [Vairimorpha ceranae]KKO74885.1 hypothetical protein AAJ76_4000013328 [Vairimorpha ceranae]